MCTECRHIGTLLNTGCPFTLFETGSSCCLSTMYSTPGLLSYKLLVFYSLVSASNLPVGKLKL